jgi:hypothetical protein
MKTQTKRWGDGGEREVGRTIADFGIKKSRRQKAQGAGCKGKGKKISDLT